MGLKSMLKYKNIDKIICDELHVHMVTPSKLR